MTYPVIPELRWHLVQRRYIHYSTYHVTPDIDRKKEVVTHDLALYGARDTEKVRHVRESARSPKTTGPFDALAYTPYEITTMH